jgi:hypothetical protein
VTPREVLVEIEGLGFRLALRLGGLRLTGGAQPPPEVLALIREHRGALLAFLQAEALVQAAHDASLAAGRLTPFPAHLLGLVHPSIRHLVTASG